MITATSSYSRSQNKNVFNYGFTIVELLVVIVIIGILASITVVSYAGITQKATAATLQSDLKNASTQLEIDKITDGVYPATKEAANGGKGLKASSGTVFSYTYSSGTDIYSLTATNKNISYYITSSNTLPIAGVPSAVTMAASFISTWGGIDSDDGRAIAKTSDGGFVIAGSTTVDVVNDRDALLAKYDASGSLSWAKTWGDTGYEVGSSVIQASDGGFVMVGSSSYAESSAFITKYDASGDLVWDKTWVGADSCSSLAQTSDGGYVIIGGYDGDSSQEVWNPDVFLSKFSSSGEFIWTKTWNGIYEDYAGSIIKTNDGGFAITGDSGSLGLGSGRKMYLSKYTSDGNVSWSKAWSLGGLDSSGSQVIQTSDGGYAITGGTYDEAGESIAYIAKYDSSGINTWNKTWDGTGWSYGNSIVQSSDGGYAITGEFDGDEPNGDIFFAKYNSSGDLSYSKIVGGSDWDSGDSMVQASDNGYIVTGIAYSYGAGDKDMIIAKFNSSGVINNCPEAICRTKLASTTTPTASVTSPTITMTSLTNTIATPATNVLTSSITPMIIVAP